MITESDRINAKIYANLLIAELGGIGVHARLTETRSLPLVSVGEGHAFMVHFRKGELAKDTLRVGWESYEGHRVSRSLDVNVEKTAAAVAKDAAKTAEKTAAMLAARERVNAAHDAVSELRAEYGLVEDEGDVQIEETNYQSGSFHVTFKTGTPEKTAAVLKALRAAGIL